MIDHAQQTAHLGFLSRHLTLGSPFLLTAGFSRLSPLLQTLKLTHSHCATGTCSLSSCFLTLPPQQCDFDACQCPTMGHLKVVSFLPQQFPQSDISVSVQGPLCSKLGIIFDIPTSNHRVNSSSPTWLLLLLFLLFLMILCQFPIHETDDLWV